jgi:V8-like Glu-specific endopeptidase
MKNRVLAIEPEQYKCSYAISTQPGQSGCPIVINERIISLHNGGIVGE